MCHQIDRYESQNRNQRRLGMDLCGADGGSGGGGFWVWVRVRARARWLIPRSLNFLPHSLPLWSLFCAGFASTSIITVFNCCFYYHIFLHLSRRETKAAAAVANWLALLPPPAVVILWQVFFSCFVFFFFPYFFFLLLCLCSFYGFSPSNLYMVLILRPGLCLFLALLPS